MAGYGVEKCQKFTRRNSFYPPYRPHQLVGMTFEISQFSMYNAQCVHWAAKYWKMPKKSQILNLRLTKIKCSLFSSELSVPGKRHVPSYVFWDFWGIVLTAYLLNVRIVQCTFIRFNIVDFFQKYAFLLFYDVTSCYVCCNNIVSKTLRSHCKNWDGRRANLFLAKKFQQ